MFYNLANSSLDGIRGKHDFLNSMGAAGLSGALYKSTCTSFSLLKKATQILILDPFFVAGVRPAALSAGLMAGAAGAWSGFKRYV